MPRSKNQISSIWPYHVYGRCINKDWFSQPLDEVWNIMSEQLHFVRFAYDIRVHAFVLMANHYHALISTPQGNLSDGMSWFARETSRTLTKSADRINQTYGSRYGSSLIQSTHHFKNVYKYIYRNPVAAGICKSVEEYPYSTLNGLLGFKPLLIPVEEDTILFDDVEKTLLWLNESPQEVHTEEIRRALKKRVFKLPVRRHRRMPSALEIDAL